ncbi:aldehyde dehydrogenase family protein, partial [Burkholderia ambifaria]|uniref:aldehyde dehydrogenase family protein n=1 Tax=Burkholderia ambifaria TaxID=152480 RepID=UPI001589E972
STPVGKQLAALAGQHMKRATMELGGHAPVIVAEDADVALAVVQHAEGLKIGNGLEEGTTLGALANPRRLTAMASVVDNARKV